MKTKIVIGIITNYVNSLSPYLEFLDNAEKYGHTINDMIIAFSHGIDSSIVDKIRTKVNLHLIKLNSDPEFITELKDIGLTEQEIQTLFYSKNFAQYGLIPYGKRRNCVLMKALLLYPYIDYLLFIDTDVKPYIIINKQGKMREIDFVGRHLEYLEKEDILITTSDYSGYYIIPPMKFIGLKELLIGLQKEYAYNHVVDPAKNLFTSSINKRNIRKTNKILGGNHAIDLQNYLYLPPYFSTTYMFNNEFIISRGEDTLMGRELPQDNKYIIDIDTRIFHNTFADFPRFPYINRLDVQERLYYACLGWLGRNPFLNWYLARNGFITEREFIERKVVQKRALEVGSKKLASYLGKEKFILLPRAYIQAYEQLDNMIANYKKTCMAWNKFIGRIRKWRCEDENFAG